MVGVVSKENLYPKSEEFKEGDRILAFPSNGLHTNGYTFAKELGCFDREDRFAWGITNIDIFAAIHRCYQRELMILEVNNVDIRAVAHITGGGIEANLNRVVPEGFNYAIHNLTHWDTNIPTVFKLLIELAENKSIPFKRVKQEFNLGVGMVAIVPYKQVDLCLSVLPESFVIGCDRRDILIDIIVLYLPFILSAITIYMSFLAGNKYKYTWKIGLANQGLWLIWILCSQSWGLIPMNIALWIVYFNNHLKWTRR
jgi:hypothetical protein